VELPLRVLVAVANPANLNDYGLDQLNVEAEQNAVAQALKTSSSDAAVVDFVPQPVTLAALDSALGRGYHVLHLVAHGMTPRQAEPTLFLADGANTINRVSDRAFAELIERRGDSLRLVFLASCQTAERGVADTSSGFAPRLIGAGVPAVIAMRGLMPQAGARSFGESFYRQLVDHGQVDLAVNEARSTLISIDAEGSWAKPILFSRVPNGRIIAPKVITPTLGLWAKLRNSTLARVIGAIVALLSLVGTLLGLSSDLPPLCEPGGLLRPICKLPPAPMPDRAFNIVVSEFGTLADDGKTISASPDGLLLSQQLFAALDSDAQLRAGAYPANVRGPGMTELPSVTQQDLESAVAHAAADHNATIFIYGLVIPQQSGQALELHFFIRDRSFSFGSEVAGATRMGRPVPFSLPLDDLTLTAANAPLKARITALQRLVGGLKNYNIGELDEAEAAFRDALALPDWAADQGKEVAYTLLGAALLRADSQQIHPAERLHNLQAAGDAFAKARDLAPDYARSYLGLGSVAIQSADASLRLNTMEARAEVPTLLDKAREMFRQARDARDQPVTAFVAIKYSYGIGQVHVSGAALKLQGWSYDEAQAAFEQVVAGYASTGSPDLLALAGHAHAYIGEIAGIKTRWDLMSTELRSGISLLESIPFQPPRAYIAYYWTRVGYAEEQAGRLNEAVAAYDQALTRGKGVVLQKDLDYWTQERERIVARKSQ
jgi:tetratricopeptide (TPR) repeat protein